MTEDQIGTCESCDKAIKDGDAHYMTADGCWLCAEHAPSLSDAIAQHEEILAADPWEPGELTYDTREEMAAGLADLKERLGEGGDYNLATGK